MKTEIKTEKNTKENTNKNINFTKSPSNAHSLKDIKSHGENENEEFNSDFEENEFIELSSQNLADKPKRKSRKSNTKINYLSNVHINPDQNYESYKKCTYRTGIIYLLRNSERLPVELNLQPIFAKIDLEFFNFYLNEMEKSKFFQLNLIDILKISQDPKLVLHNCINIILNHIDSNILLKGPMSICFKNKNNMIDWVKTVHNFKECQLDSNNHKKDNKVLIDFRKVNKLMPIDSILNSNKNLQEKKENTLFYDNSDKVLRKKNIYTKKEEKVKYLMEKIVSSITSGSIETNLIKRKMINQLKETRNSAKMMENQQNLIKKIVEKRIEKENEKKEKLLTLEAKNKEIRLLKAVKSKILQLKEKEVKTLDKELKKQITIEKKISNNKTQKMINYLVNKSQTILPSKARREAAARLEQGLPPKKIEGVKIAVPALGKKNYDNFGNKKNSKGGKTRKLLILPKGKIRLPNGKKVKGKILSNGNIKLANGKILTKEKIYKINKSQSKSISNQQILPNGKVLLSSKLTKKQIKKLTPQAKKILLDRVEKAAMQKAKAEKIVIPGIDKNPFAVGSVSNMAIKVMENKTLKNYNRCIDSRVLNFTNKNYIFETCKDIFGESVNFFIIFSYFLLIFFSWRINVM